MNKKGDTRPILMTMCILAVLLLVGFFFGHVKMVAKDTGSMAMYFALDMAYLIDALYAAPDSAKVFYPFILENSFKVTVSDDNVTIERRFVPYEKNSTYKRFGANKFSALKFEPLSQNIIFTRTFGYLAIHKEDKATLKQLRCMDIEPSKKIDESEIVIDPGAGTEKALEITNALDSRLRNLFYDIFFTRKTSIERTLEERLGAIRQETDVVLSIEIGSNPDTELNFVKAYIPFDSPESQRMACTILNLMVDKISDIDGISIIPTDREAILSKNNGIAIKFIIGNINKPRDKNMLYLYPYKISNSIVEGIEAHYGI